MTRDVGLAEDLAQDALVAALEQWPSTGVPDNPAAWLMTIAKRRAVDHFRRADNLRGKLAELVARRERRSTMPDLDSQVDHIEDDVLRLDLPVLPPLAQRRSRRAALTLRLVGGLTTAEIARGFLASESAMGQRISRAKKTLSAGRAEFELPVGAERTERLDDVMAVIYLIFNEGYTATAGDDWMRPDLAAEATRLARMLASLRPTSPRCSACRRCSSCRARGWPPGSSAAGEPVLLEDQDRTRWDQLMIRRGLAALRRAADLAARGTPVGKYFLQASIAAQHARRRTRRGHGLAPDRRRCTTCSPTPPPARSSRSTAPSRTVARSGPTPAWPCSPRSTPTRSADSPLVPSVRGDLLERAGLHAAAAEAFSEAAGRTRERGGAGRPAPAGGVEPVAQVNDSGTGRPSDASTERSRSG